MPKKKGTKKLVAAADAASGRIERKANIFISWSGDRSKKVALALRGWLDRVIQAAKPWMSEEDIEKGTRWWHQLGLQLDKSDFGIVCLTPENLKSELLNFEAGALSSDLDDSRVCPYLFDIDKADVGRPFSEFQLTVSTQEDTLKLVATINKAMSAPLDETRLKSTFDKWWPDLEKELKAVRHGSRPSPKRRGREEILDEILDIVRKLDLRLRSPIVPSGETRLSDIFGPPNTYAWGTGEGGGVLQKILGTARGVGGAVGSLTEEPKAKEPKKE
jgi:TIR domain